MTRPIVQHPLIMAGRWRLDGTTISVADIRHDGHRLGRTDTLRAYGFLDLTDPELDAIMAFDFPAVRELVVNLASSSVKVECTCGEDTPAASTEPIVTVHCICGRIWQVSVTTRLLNGGA